MPRYRFLLTFCTLALACSSEPPAAPDPAESTGPVAGKTREIVYRPIDLGNLGGPGSVAQGINNRGVVVGLCTTASAPSLEQACVWRQPGVLPPVALPPLSGQTVSQASDINDAGDIVGIADGGDGSHAILWPASGGLVDLGRTSNNPFPSINRRGDVVWAVPAPFGESGPTHVALRRNGVIRDLGIAVPNQGGGYGSPAGISDDGLIAVVGGAYWKRDRWLPLPRPENVTGDVIPTHVTEEGDIVGQMGGGYPAELGLWWPTPKRVRVLVPGFVAYDLGGNNVLVGEGRLSLEGGAERTVAATFTVRRGLKPLPTPEGYDPRGRAIRMNGSGVIIGFTVRPSPDQINMLDNRATMWVP